MYGDFKHNLTEKAAFATGQRPHQDHAVPRAAMPIVAVEVLGPDEINVGGVASFTIVAANLGEIAVEPVHVKVALPAGAQVAQVHPIPAARHSDGLRFDLGRLTPKSRQRIQIELVAGHRGAMPVHAEAIFSVAAQATTKVCQPELVMNVFGPEAVVVGDTAMFKIVVENRGDGPAEDVAVAQRTSDDPHAATGAAHVGHLGPGQAREIYLSALTHEAGCFRACFLATAWGNLIVEAETNVRVARPLLTVAATGPRICTVQSPEVFTLELANPGDAAASNIEAVTVIPAGVQVVAFDRPVQFDVARRIVRWRVPTLAPGGREVLRMKAAAIQVDRFSLQLAAAGDHGLRAECEHLCEAVSYHRRTA